MSKKIVVIFLVILIVVAGVYFFSQTGKKTNQPLSTKEKESKGYSQTMDFNNQETATVAGSGLALEISQPTNKSVVSTTTVLIKGKTSPQAEVFVNDKETVADSQGNFSLSASLEEGDNYILIAANDNRGNYAEQELTVTLESVQ